MKIGDIIFIIDVPYYFKNLPVNFIGETGKILFFDDRYKDLAKIELNNPQESVYLFKKYFIIIGE